MKEQLLELLLKVQFLRSDLKELTLFMPKDNEYLLGTLYSQKWKIAMCMEAQPSFLEFSYGKAEMLIFENLVIQSRASFDHK